MVELEGKTTSITEEPGASAPQAVFSPAPNPEDREKTAGEKIFDRTVYTGIGFGVNEGLSLWITDQFVYGQNLLKNVPGLEKTGMWFSKEGYEAASESIAKGLKLTETITKDGRKILPKERAGNSVLMVTLLAGGTALVLPMKWLEDSKGYWTQKANHLADHMKGNQLTSEQVEARDKEVAEHIAAEPKQSWPSLLVGRTVACLASVTTGTIIGHARNEALMDKSERFFTGSIQPKDQKSMKNRYARLVSVETYSCLISSTVLEGMSKLFAKRSSKKSKLPADHIQTTTEAPPTSSEHQGTMDDRDTKTVGHHTANIQSERSMITADNMDKHDRFSHSEPAESHTAAIESRRDQADESLSMQA